MQSTGNGLIQAIEIVQGQTKITTGVIDSAIAIVCHADGDVRVSFPDNSSETVSCVKGESFSLAYLKVEVLSGSFTVN